MVGVAVVVAAGDLDVVAVAVVAVAADATSVEHTSLLQPTQCTTFAFFVLL